MRTEMSNLNKSIWSHVLYFNVYFVPWYFINDHLLNWMSTTPARPHSFTLCDLSMASHQQIKRFHLSLIHSYFSGSLTSRNSFEPLRTTNKRFAWRIPKSRGPKLPPIILTNMQSVWVTAIVKANKTRLARRHSIGGLFKRSLLTSLKVTTVAIQLPRSGATMVWRPRLSEKATSWARPFVPFTRRCFPPVCFTLSVPLFFFFPTRPRKDMIYRAGRRQTNIGPCCLAPSEHRHTPCPPTCPLFRLKGPLLGAAGSRRLALFGFSDSGTHITFKGPFLVSRQIKVILQ